MTILDKRLSLLSKKDMTKAINILSDAFIGYPFPGGLIKDSAKRQIVITEMF